jgi:LCP family protein required for cell wall assembly
VALTATRLVQLLGLVVAAFGLWGYWNATDPAAPAPLGQAEAALVNPGGESFQASFVVAGRDIEYDIPAQDPIYRDGRLLGFRTPARGKRYGNRTDSILYVQIVGNRVYVISIPRDIWLPQHQIKVNETVGYARLGPDGLRRAVSEIIGLPVDYYAIVNIDLFERLVDAVGGVEVYVPYPMRYTDTAADLHIDFDEGLHHFTGAEAADFARYRWGPGGDYGRIDNIKRIGMAMLDKFRAFELRAFVGLPELIATLFDEVETNADSGIVSELLKRRNRLEIAAATLPTHSSEVYRNDPKLGQVRTATEFAKSEEVDAFLAATFGGKARQLEAVPEASLVISNRSGWAGLEDVVKARLVAFGVPEERILTQELFPDALPTRVQAEREDWQNAAFYANMLNVQRAQVYRINRPQQASQQGSQPSPVGLELILGQDAVGLLAPPGLAPSAFTSNRREGTTSSRGP